MRMTIDDVVLLHGKTSAGRRPCINQLIIN